MIWMNETTGVLECGCRTDNARKLTLICPAHRGEGEVKLESFSLKQAETIRTLQSDLKSARAALQRAQTQREQAHSKLRRQNRFSE